MAQRSATEQEVRITVESGERFEAKFNRIGFRKNFMFENRWLGKQYRTKQVEVYAVREEDDWLIISVITRYF